MRSIWPALVIVCFLPFYVSPATASDRAKEKRWANQIVDSIMVGDAQWLSVGKHKILALYAEQETKKAKGGAIVLHGAGVHPNWDSIVRPVRSGLPKHGWSTLSVQMPILANDAKMEEYAPLFEEVKPRLDAAVKFLRDKGIDNIVIVAHSLGSAMAAYYLRDNPPSIKALVAIGATGSHFKDKDKNYIKALKTIKVPVMDLFGALDEPDVIATANKKVKVARAAGNKNYTQIKVKGADHFFTGKQEILLKHVSEWLEKFAKK